ncbi:unnamed protein product [Thelazia callipaeda]|uniref:MFS domain-containing protein n=1 Tax=Thelazia callipaeda TaxID=103827 RepID=A0A0N5DAX0_THECL|nr:unnamed protein product [Thelazia callipaeda]
MTVQRSTTEKDCVDICEEKKVSLSISTDGSTVQLDPEKLLNAFGKYGKHQMRSYILLAITALFYSSHILIMGFITQIPPFRCSFTQLNISEQKSYQMLDSCNVLEHETGNILQCLNVYNSKYIYEEKAPFSTLISEFNLVCNDEHWAEHGSSLFMLGKFSGLFIPLVTQLSDLYGRRKVLLFTMWISSITAFACSLAPTILTFLIFRTILGITISGAFTVVWILCCELVAVEFRSLIPIAFTVTWVLGILIVGILRIWILSWRWLYFVLSLPSLLTISYHWFVPESPYWLIGHNLQKDIELYIKEVSHCNKVCIDVRKCESNFQQRENDKSRTIIDIFRNKVALFHLCVQCYVMMAMNLSYLTMALMSVTLSEDTFSGYFLSGFSELPGGLLAVLLLQKFGRRPVSAWSFLMQSVFQILALLFRDFKELQIGFAIIARFLNSVIWVSQPLLLAEMSPTTVRNTFYGFVQTFAVIGSISASYLSILKSASAQTPAAIVAGASFIAALLMLTAPETKNRSMPEDLNQLDPGCFLRLLGCGYQKKHRGSITPDDEQEATSLFTFSHCQQTLTFTSS